MHVTSDRSTTSNSNFLSVMLAFVVCVVLAIGAILYYHQRHVQEQRAYAAQQKMLYAEYVTWNTWRDPVRAAYAKLSPALDEMDKFDRRSGDVAKLDAAMQVIRDGAAAVRACPKGFQGPGIAYRSRLEALVSSYTEEYRELRLPWSLDQPGKRVWAENEVSGTLYQEAFKRSNVRPAISQLKQFHEEALNMSDDALKQKLLGADLSGFGLREIVRSARDDFERLLVVKPVVPPGLDASTISAGGR